MYFQHDITEQKTLPLSAIAFLRYMSKLQIEPLDVAIRSGVRYLTVWKIGQGRPIKSRDEVLIRQGLFRMTGIPYTAPILVHRQHEQDRQKSQTPPPSSERTQWN
jgi:hypothetical protein